MRTFIIAGLVAVGLSAGCTSIEPVSTMRTPIPGSAASPSYPTTTSHPRGDAMYKVGVDIQLGTYRVTPNTNVPGYYVLCATANCEITFSQEPGMIKNEIVSGPEYMEITPDVKYVKLERLNIELS